MTVSFVHSPSFSLIHQMIIDSSDTSSIAGTWFYTKDDRFRIAHGPLDIIALKLVEGLQGADGTTQVHICDASRSEGEEEMDMTYLEGDEAELVIESIGSGIGRAHEARCDWKL